MSRLFAGILALLLLGGCGGETPEKPQDDENAVSIPFRKDGTLTFWRDGSPVATIDIEIAESDSARARGLMQRESLPEQSGMLFLFNREEMQSFWMANTPLALDIMFVDADSQIVDIAKYTRPFSSSSIASGSPARYVVEVPAGFSDRYGIAESDKVTWRREG